MRDRILAHVRKQHSVCALLLRIEDQIFHKILYSTSKDSFSVECCKHASFGAILAIQLIKWMTETYFYILI